MSTFLPRCDVTVMPTSTASVAGRAIISRVSRQHLPADLVAFNGRTR
jgi:hypothetical protein